MKKLIAIVLIVISLVALTACVTTAKDKDARMVTIEDHAGTYAIVYDKYTKVMYAVSNGAYNCGVLTLLVDANGKPLLYQDN